MVKISNCIICIYALFFKLFKNGSMYMYITYHVVESNQKSTQTLECILVVVDKHVEKAFSVLIYTPFLMPEFRRGMCFQNNY